MIYLCFSHFSESAVPREGTISSLLMTPPKHVCFLKPSVSARQECLTSTCRSLTETVKPPYNPQVGCQERHVLIASLRELSGIICVFWVTAWRTSQPHCCDSGHGNTRFSPSLPHSSGIYLWQISTSASWKKN